MKNALIYWFMMNVAIPIGVATLMVSCGPSIEEIEANYETKTITVECVNSMHGLETISVCTKVPKPGRIDHDMSLRLDGHVLKNYWREAVAADVLSYRILPDSNETKPNELDGTSQVTTITTNYKIKLPEHYTSITMDNNHPTDLTGFIRNDTIIINFKNY